MDPFLRPERQPDEDKGHEKPTWPWESMQKKQQDEQQEKKTKKEEKKEKQPKVEEEKTKESEKDPTEKHEKRSSLIEQALTMVAQHEEEPAPRDAPTLAQLMIARHVVHLHEQLQHPELIPEDSSVESIEATLDYIVHLDAKFKDPSVEAAPEIEASYHEIITQAEAVLAEETNVENVINDLRQTNGDTSSPIDSSPHSFSQQHQPGDRPTAVTPPARKQIKQETDPTQEEFDRRIAAVKNSAMPLAAAAALIYSITHLGRKKKKPESSTASADKSERDNTYVGATSLDDQPDTPASTFSSAPTAPAPRETIQSQTRPERPTIPQREFTPPFRPRPVFAATAVASTLAAHRSQKHEHTPDQPAYTAPLTETSKPHTTPETHVDIDTPTKSDRKIEHMPLLQLLGMAEGVSLGHGRYLRREFEAGAIDREGLVKILKAQSKGQDYQWEFRQQAVRFATLKNTSPEFLHTAKSSSQPESEEEFSSLDNQPEATSNPLTPPERAPQPLSLAPPRTDHPLLPKFASSTLSKPPTTQRIVLITAALIGGLTVVTLLAMLILAWLS